MTKDKAVCPSCKLSTGLTAEAAVVVAWSKGAWRIRSEPEVLGEASAGCEKCGWFGDAHKCFEH